MEIMFLGPLGKVTGSCSWMRDVAQGWSFLVDCGMQQGEHSAAKWNSCDWPFDPAELNFVALTHAHVDHSGLIPVLYKRGFRGPVYATQETQEIAKVLLTDASGFPGALFTAEDVDAICWREPGGYPLLGGYHPVNKDLFLRFFRSGHVLGAVSVGVYWGSPREDQKSIVFSGDLGPNVEDAESLPFLRHRMGVGKFDFVVMESTYGGVTRPLEESCPNQRREQLRAWLDKTIKLDGVLAIPAFALGRTQDVLFDIHWIVAEDPAKYEGVEFLLDSPSGSKINQIVSKAMDRTESNRMGKVRPLWLGKQMCTWFGLEQKNPEHLAYARRLGAMALGQLSEVSGYKPDSLNEVGRAWRSLFKLVTNRKRVAKERKGPAVLILTSGMGEGGPAAFWLPHLLQDARNSVVFAGYCTPSSLGGRLLSLDGVPASERKLLTESLCWKNHEGVKEMPLAAMEAGVGLLSGYSAHADQTGLVEWAFNAAPGKVQSVSPMFFLQHGTNERRLELAKALKARAEQDGVDVMVVCPTEGGGWLDLDQGAVEVDRERRRQKLRAQMLELERQYGEV